MSRGAPYLPNINPGRDQMFHVLLNGEIQFESNGQGAFATYVGALESAKALLFNEDGQPLGNIEIVEDDEAH